MMAILTFAELHAEVAAFHAREAAENAPLAVACRALDTLRAALAEMGQLERDEIVDELAALVAEQDAAAFAALAVGED